MLTPNFESYAVSAPTAKLFLIELPCLLLGFFHCLFYLFCCTFKFEIFVFKSNTAWGFPLVNVATKVINQYVGIPSGLCSILSFVSINDALDLGILSSLLPILLRIAFLSPANGALKILYLPLTCLIKLNKFLAFAVVGSSNQNFSSSLIACSATQ